MTIMSLLISLVGLAVFLILHVIAWRLLPPPRKGLLLLVIAACAGYIAAALTAHFALRMPFVAHAPVSVPVFLFLGICYFHFYYAVDRSVSVRTLGALASAEKGRLTPQELDALYPREEMIRRRLNIMLEHGWLTERDGVFDCTPKARRLTRFARLGAWLYRLDATG